MTQFMAIGKGSVTGPSLRTPRDAAHAFFERYPHKRVCSVVEGELVHQTFRSQPRVHKYWRDITRKMVDQLLPDMVA